MICKTHSILIFIYSCSVHHITTHLLTRLLSSWNLFLELHDELLISREEIPPSETFHLIQEKFIESHLDQEYDTALAVRAMQ